MLALLLGLSGLLQAADAPPSDSDTSKDTSKADNQSGISKKPPPKEEPPKKTEYDKLPLPKLLAKANANDLTAQFELASRFNYGRGMPKNTGEALLWLRRAGNGGQEDAARLLAVKLYNGHDVLPDFGEAMKWAYLLADKGDIPAQLMLASMYANGEGTQRDLVQAYKWNSIAAVGAKRAGSKEEPKPEQVQAAITARDKLGSLLTDEQETEAQKLASDWWMQKYAAPVKTQTRKTRPKNTK
jgi:hypothetical protein